MDPNAALVQLREKLAAAVAVLDAGAEPDPTVLQASLSEVAESFRGLDGWLRTGGFAPDDWPLVTHNRVRDAANEAASWIATRSNDTEQNSLADIMVNLTLTWLFNHTIEQGDAIAAIAANWDERPSVVLEWAGLETEGDDDNGYEERASDDEDDDEDLAVVPVAAG